MRKPMTAHSPILWQPTVTTETEIGKLKFSQGV
jgi:hypothetical protein